MRGQWWAWLVTVHAGGQSSLQSHRIYGRSWANIVVKVIIGLVPVCRNTRSVGRHLRSIGRRRRTPPPVEKAGLGFLVVDMRSIDILKRDGRAPGRAPVLIPRVRRHGPTNGDCQSPIRSDVKKDWVYEGSRRNQASSMLQKVSSVYTMNSLYRKEKR